MLQSICNWRLRIAKAFQDTNHNIEGFDFFSRKSIANILVIYIYPFYIFLITLPQKRNCNTYITMLLFLSTLSGQKISALNFLKLNVLLD